MMGCKFLMAATILCAGLSQPSLADERTWNWIFVSPVSGPASKSAWWTEQGIAKDGAAGSKFDIHIGGAPHQLDLYELKGVMRAGAVTATLTGLDTDEIPQRYSGKVLGKGNRISLVGSNGDVILLYPAAGKSAQDMVGP